MSEMTNAKSIYETIKQRGHRLPSSSDGEEDSRPRKTARRGDLSQQEAEEAEEQDHDGADEGAEDAEDA